MITSLSLVYSAAAVRRILSTKYQIVRIEKWWKICLVIFRGCRPRFVSRTAFCKHFVEWRKAQAKALVVRRQLNTINQFVVRNEIKQTKYTITAMQSGLICECEDYNNQIKYLGKGCCKHGYAALSYLGFNSLQDYLAALGSVRKAP